MACFCYRLPAGRRMTRAHIGPRSSADGHEPLSLSRVKSPFSSGTFSLKASGGLCWWQSWIKLLSLCSWMVLLLEDSVHFCWIGSRCKFCFSLFIPRFKLPSLHRHGHFFYVSSWKRISSETSPLESFKQSHTRIKICFCWLSSRCSMQHPINLTMNWSSYLDGDEWAIILDHFNICPHWPLVRFLLLIYST